MHNIELTKIGKTRKTSMTTIDFINVRGQQNLDGEAMIKPIGKKIKSELYIQNVFDKYKKNTVKFIHEGLFFLGTIKNDTEKIFMTPGWLVNAKHLLINGKFYQTIGVVNLSKIENLDEIRKSSRWVNAEFQSQGEIGKQNTLHTIS